MDEGGEDRAGYWAEQHVPQLYPGEMQGVGTPVGNGSFYAAASTPPENLSCPEGAIQEFIGGSWFCTMNGALVTPVDDEDFTPEGEYIPGAWPPAVFVPPASGPGQDALPKFVGGRMGKVVYAQIQNRNLTGIRYGTLPRVVMMDEAPPSYGMGWTAAAGRGSEEILE